MSAWILLVGFVSVAGAEGFDAQAVYAKASPAVVAIIAAREDGVGDLGSGSVVDDKGSVLTNAHVLIDKATRRPFPSLHVYFKPTRMTGDPQIDMRNPVEAAVVSYDSALDLALIRPKSLPGKITPLGLADSGDVSIGERVAAIGHPEQGGLWTLTTGVVSSLVADLGKVKGKQAFQTDASINRGNSGGPLLNASGHIIGVNTSIARKASDGLAITSVNFAVTSAVAKAWLKKTKEVALAEPEGKREPVAASKPKQEEEPKAKAAPPSPGETPPPLSARGGKGKAREMITESQPFSPERLIEAEMREMEDLGEEMHREVLKRSSQIPQ